MTQCQTLKTHGAEEKTWRKAPRWIVNFVPATVLSKISTTTSSRNKRSSAIPESSATYPLPSSSPLSSQILRLGSGRVERTDGHPAEREAATQSTYSSISHLVRRRRLLSSPKKGFAQEQVGLLLDLIRHSKLCIMYVRTK